MGGRVFVTVGTTRFDELIRAVDSHEVSNILRSRGHDALVVQKGSGEYKMRNLLTKDEATTTLANGLKVECFDFLPSIADHIASASLVICHAGAGSIFEGLRAGKRLVVVPNTSLMDNHQIELAQHLEHLGHLVCASPETLPSVLSRLDDTNFVPFEKGSPDSIVTAIDRLVGFSD